MSSQMMSLQLGALPVSYSTNSTLRRPVHVSLPYCRPQASAILSGSSSLSWRNGLGVQGYSPAAILLKRRQTLRTVRRNTDVVQAVGAAIKPSSSEQTHHLHGGAVLSVSVEDQVVRLRCNPPPGAPANWQMPALMLHWGVAAAGGEKWFLPPIDHRPPGTMEYKRKALQTPLNALDPRAPHGGEYALDVKLFNPGTALKFVLVDTSTNFWHKCPDSGNGDFTVPLGVSSNGNGAAPAAAVAAAAPAAPVKVPDQLYEVWAYLKWESAGRPQLSAEGSVKAFNQAVEDVDAQIAAGTPLVSLLEQCGLDPALAPPTPAAAPAPLGPPPPLPASQPPVAKAPMTPPPPPAAAVMKSTPPPPKVAPPAPQKAAAPPPMAPPKSQPPPPKIEGPIEVPESLKGLCAYILWEEAGCPDGADFGDQAKGELEAAMRNGMSSSDCEYRLKNAKYGATTRERLGLNAPGSSPAPPATQPVQKAAAVQHTSTAAIDFHVDLGHFNQDQLISRQGGISGGEGGIQEWMLNKIADAEPGCTRSFMHRYYACSDMWEEALGSGQEGALAGLFIWLRFCSLRQLVWNKNYNIKPREISQAQEKLTNNFQYTFKDRPEFREMARLCMSTVGRGGEGNGGQRIRDEILDIQRANHCMGGFMEEWHQKLHNNTTPDDVIICQGLLDYIDSGLDISKFWDTLHANSIDRDRLKSYDRSIGGTPEFKPEQCDGLKRDLTNYLQTLKAVHSGADLNSAAAYVFGYKQAKCKGKEVEVGAVSEVATPKLKELLESLKGAMEQTRMASLKGGAAADPLQALKIVIAARRELRGHLTSGNDFGGRLKDVIYLDLALEQTARTVLEGGSTSIQSAGAPALMEGVALALENVCLSSESNEEMVLCLKEWQNLTSQGGNWALRAKAGMDRIRGALQASAEKYNARFQDAAGYLGGKLNVDHHVIQVFSEEVIRGGGAAPLSILLNKLDPVLRQAADLGAWQVISPVEVAGYVLVVERLSEVQNNSYDRPTVVVAGRVSGEEELPVGCVAVLTPDMPDVLSHVAVRARNEQVCFASCFDAPTFEHLRGLNDQVVQLNPAGTTLNYSVGDASMVKSPAEFSSQPTGSVQIEKRVWEGMYAVDCDEMNDQNVGGKSRNLAQLRGLLPEDIKLPAQVAMPFGTFEAVLEDPLNAGVKAELEQLTSGEMDVAILPTVRETILKVQPTPQMLQELESKMRAAGLKWPADEGAERWAQAWRAITGVWASKWTERAFLARRKAGMSNDHLSMAVLCQQVVPAAYAFVIHTVHPQTGDTNQVYCELVRGLGEVLVGNYPGRALSFVTNKDDIQHPQVVGFPSKSVGLFVPESLIFRSDSNGEDLEGFAGAGLYDSITMDECIEHRIEYSEDPMVNNPEYQQYMLSRIASAGYEIEKILGSPQDLEGCITSTGELFIVQTRPQV